MSFFVVVLCFCLFPVLFFCCCCCLVVVVVVVVVVVLGKCCFVFVLFSLIAYSIYILK